MVWEEGKRISKNIFTFSRHFISKFAISEGPKGQGSSTHSLLSEEWRVMHLLGYFCVILGLLKGLIAALCQ